MDQYFIFCLQCSKAAGVNSEGVTPGTNITIPFDSLKEAKEMANNIKSTVGLLMAV